MKNIIVLLRVKDWLKNIVIFFPILFSSQLFYISHYSSLFIGFISFCILSSFIYVLNDILDIKSDQKHPLKKFQKPLAKGAIKLQKAYFILSVLFIAFIFFLYYFPILRPNLILYFLLSFFYNFGVKKIPFLEIFVLSFGYVIRTDTGSKIINVESSTLMLIAVLAIGIFFILLKRQSELNLNNNLHQGSTRFVLNYYHKNIINYLCIATLLLLKVIFIIYIFLINYSLILCFILILIFLLVYYLLVKDNHSGENPITFIFSNKFLLILSFFIFMSSLILYL